MMSATARNAPELGVGAVWGFAGSAALFGVGAAAVHGGAALAPVVVLLGAAAAAVLASGLGRAALALLAATLGVIAAVGPAATPAVALPVLLALRRHGPAAAGEGLAFAALAFALTAIAGAEAALGAFPALLGVLGLGCAALASSAASSEGRTAPPLLRLDQEGRILGATRAARARLGRRGRFALLDATGEPAFAEASRRAPASLSADVAGRRFVVELWPAGRDFVALLVDAQPIVAAAEANAAALARAQAQRTAELSHELRTPLNHIIGFGELMQSQAFGPVTARNAEYLGLILQSARNLLALLGGLMDLSRIGAGRFVLERERFDARALIAEAARLFAVEAERRAVTIETSLPEAALAIDADPGALRQILQNLLGNALKFTPEGGRIALRGARAGEALLIEVEDSGPGIPEAERARLTEPFTRGRAGARSVEGVGLGLALVAAFVDLHGGAVSFEDGRALGGALVRVTLPVVAGAERQRPL